MSAPEDTITQLAVRELAAAGAVREAVLVPDPQVPDAWLLRVRTGTLERTLRMRDEVRPRSFASSDAAVRLARKLGIRALLVDLAAPVAVARRRPRAALMFGATDTALSVPSPRALHFSAANKDVE